MYLLLEIIPSWIRKHSKFTLLLLQHDWGFSILAFIHVDALDFCVFVLLSSGWCNVFVSWPILDSSRIIQNRKYWRQSRRHWFWLNTNLHSITNKSLNPWENFSLPTQLFFEKIWLNITMHIKESWEHPKIT